MDVLSGIMTTFMNYCYAFTQNVGYPSYGAAIIMLTLIIKLVLAPLTAKQIRSMEGMQTLQPKIKELQKKYKGNQKKMQEEMTKLYREMGVNPLSGCLPILIQMPFLIAIFYALRDRQAFWRQALTDDVMDLVENNEIDAASSLLRKRLAAWERKNHET